MEECEKRVLSQFRARIANEIVVTSSFLSAFCEQSILDEEMTRLVRSEENYTTKAIRLLELLPKRGPKAFTTLMEILEITNPWLSEKMKTALHEERTRAAKLKVSSSNAEAASIKGYGSSICQNVDNDLKAVVLIFVRNNLAHLTDADQKATARWLGEELQRERRRQLFRSPSSFRRQPQEFQSCKETQTEMKGMELKELLEDVLVQLYGVDHVAMAPDFSFKSLQKEIMELIQRLQKMDLMAIECLEKFDDTDRFALSLPDLIDRSLLRQKELVRALMEDRRRIQRLMEEREMLSKHCKRLEEEMEKFVRTSTQGVGHPHQNYLRKKKEIQQRYTLPKHSPPVHNGDVKHKRLSTATPRPTTSSSHPPAGHNADPPPASSAALTSQSTHLSTVAAAAFPSAPLPGEETSESPESNSPVLSNGVELDGVHGEAQAQATSGHTAGSGGAPVARRESERLAVSFRMSSTSAHLRSLADIVANNEDDDDEEDESPSPRPRVKFTSGASGSRSTKTAAHGRRKATKSATKSTHK